MPSNKHKCDASVLNACITNKLCLHKTCDKKRSFQITGLELNRLLKTYVFINNQSYQVCHTFFTHLKNGIAR